MTTFLHTRSIYSRTSIGINYNSGFCSVCLCLRIGKGNCIAYLLCCTPQYRLAIIINTNCYLTGVIIFIGCLFLIITTVIISDAGSAKLNCSSIYYADRFIAAFLIFIRACILIWTFVYKMLILLCQLLRFLLRIFSVGRRCYRDIFGNLLQTTKCIGTHIRDFFRQRNACNAI